MHTCTTETPLASSVSIKLAQALFSPTAWVCWAIPTTHWSHHFSAYQVSPILQRFCCVLVQLYSLACPPPEELRFSYDSNALRFASRQSQVASKWFYATSPLGWGSPTSSLSGPCKSFRLNRSPGLLSFHHRATTEVLDALENIEARNFCSL